MPLYKCENLLSLYCIIDPCCLNTFQSTLILIEVANVFYGFGFS